MPPERRPRHPSRSPRRRAALLAATVSAAAVLMTGCGGTGSPKGITDAATRSTVGQVPDWFPAAFPPPQGGVIVEVIDTPSTDNDAIKYGRSVTWRVDQPYATVLKNLDTVLAGLAWQPTDRLATKDEQDSQRTSIYIENGTVEVIRVYTDANLKGVRVTVELPS